MSQDNVTKTGKGSNSVDGKVGATRRSIIARIVRTMESIGDFRVALGQQLRELLATGMSKAAAIAAITSALPRRPQDYLGGPLNGRMVNALIAMADAVDKHAHGFISPKGNNVVREEDIAALKLDAERSAAIMTSLANALEGKPGLSVASVAAAVRTVRNEGAESEKGEAAVTKLLDRIAETEGYVTAEKGSIAEAEFILRERTAARLRAQDALNRAKKAEAEAKAELEARRAAASLLIAEEKARAEAEEAAAKVAAERKASKGTGGKAATPGAQVIQAAAAQ